MVLLVIWLRLVGACRLCKIGVRDQLLYYEKTYIFTILRQPKTIELLYLC